MRKQVIARYRIVPVLGFALIALSLVQGQATETAVVEARMTADLKFLASDQCEGRGVQTKGINLAADYIAQEFKKANLKPGTKDGSYFQPFSITGTAKLGAENKVVLKGPLGQEMALEMGKHFTVVAMGKSGKVSAPVVFAGYGVTAKEPAYDDFQGLDVSGKVVIMLRQLPRQESKDAPGLVEGRGARQGLVTKASNAEVHKAAAVIFVNDNVTAAAADKLMDFSYTVPERSSIGMPLVHVRRSDINTMMRSATGMDLAETEKAIDRDLKPHSVALAGWTCEIQTTINRADTAVKNVVGVLQGAGPLAEETVVIGAHYDHLGYGGRGSGSLRPQETAIHYGADDNASGTVSLMELARRFGAISERQGRRLVFIAFSGEESGLLGSLHYCKEPLFPLDKTVAMVNMDMVGRLRDDKIQMYGTSTAKGFTELVDGLNEKYKFKMEKIGGANPSFGSSDHYSFYLKSIPVLFPFTGLHQQYHRPTDTADTINVPGMRRIADLTGDIVERLMVVEPRPEFVKAAASARRTSASGGRGPRLGVMPSYAENKEGQEGMLLEDVSPGGLAAKVGLKGGDRIVEISGKPVKSVEGYMTVMGGFKAGDKIEVNVLRGEKKEKFTITLE